VVTSGDTVKGQVNATLATFSGATSQLQTMVLGRLDTVQVTDSADATTQY
jgi:hypothetical protein